MCLYKEKIEFVCSIMQILRHVEMLSSTRNDQNARNCFVDHSLPSYRYLDLLFFGPVVSLGDRLNGF